MNWFEGVGEADGCTQNSIDTVCKDHHSYLGSSCLGSHEKGVTKQLSYSPSAIQFLVKESEAIIEEGRYISNMVSHEYDKRILNLSMDDYQSALAKIRERIVLNGTQKHFEIVSNIGTELYQLQKNVSKGLQSDETFLLLLKLKATERMSHISPPAVKVDHRDKKTLEAVEEPSQLISSENADEHVHHSLNDDNPSEDIQEAKTNTEEEVEVTRTTITIEELKRLAEEIRGVMSKGKTIIGKEILDLDFSHSWTTKFVRRIAENHLLPDSIVRINAYSLDDDNQQLQNMLEFSVKHDVKGLALNLDATETVSEFKIEIGSYLNSIISVLPFITENIELRSFNITGIDLEDIVKSCKHLKNEISFAGSDIIVSHEPDFGAGEFHVESLNLDECTISSLHGDQLAAKNLVNAISKSGLCESLKTINRWKGNLSEETLKELFNSKKISNIWIERE